MITIARLARILAVVSWAIFAPLSMTHCLFAQTTVSTGSIVGTISDPSGAVVNGADVTIMNIATGQVVHLSTNSSGTFNSGALIPGDYTTRIAAKGFRSAEVSTTVLLGNTAAVNVSLQIGNEKEVVEVRSSTLVVNTEQATMQGVLNTEQIENLPVNGRNFLDLAQLEPGVQIQDAANYAVGKDGYSSISFGGRFGRTARIEVDGLDVSDEILGSTTINIPASAIQEFQLSQSSLDLSTELTTSGAINVMTRSGSDDLHGEVLTFFATARWRRLCLHRRDFQSRFNARSLVVAWVVPSSKTNSFTSWMRSARSRISRHPCSWLPPSSNTPGASAHRSMRTT